ncbi:hypothetical protein J5X84_21630 [Streptosporangiaceae bacterium NEAU-GS5]|nr:hypothetical protein [Streptosporangiaceae bacterium NEAU-GS5]
MTNSPILSREPRPVDVRCTTDWLRRHDLSESPSTSLLSARLAVRRRARTLGSILLALLILGAAAIQVSNGLVISPFGPDGTKPLLLGALVAGLLMGRTLLDAWIRRVDRQVGMTLTRRAAHPAQPGLRALLGRPYAIVSAASYAGAFALAGGALAVGDDTVRRAAVVLLVAVAGVGLGTILQLRELLARPVVAEDEISLTADVIMRIEDARESTNPAILWALPMVLVFGFAPGWWNAAAVGFVLVGLAAFIAVQYTTACAADVARNVVGVR